jgi:hypothetical protein
MPTSRDRRFTIIDAMILIAAVATGMAWRRAAGFPASRQLNLAVVERWTEGTVAFLTLTWIGLRMRRPRPTFRHLIRQPGSAMCFASAAVMLATLFEGLVDIAFRLPNPKRFASTNYYVGTIDRAFPSSPYAGPAALGVLLILLASGRGRRGRGWIERMGQGLGAYWIFWLVVDWFGPLF